MTEKWTDEDHIAVLDPVAFVRRFLQKEPYPFQRVIIQNLLKHKYVLVLCARQMGKTEVLAMYITWYAVANKNAKILIFAPKYEQAVENLFARVAQQFKTNEKLKGLVAKDPVSGKLKIGVDYLQLINGTEIRAFSASKEANIEGWTGHVIVIDESQGVPDLTFYKKILPMATAVDGQVIQIGTPRAKNHFYECYNDRKMWQVLEFDWRHGHKKYREKVKEFKKIMPPEDFKTEYELQWIDEDSLYFSPKNVQKCVVEYDLPYTTNSDLYCGIDLAKKLDKTVVTLVTVEGGVYKIVDIRVVSGNYDVQKQKILELLDHYRPKRVFVDATGLGTVFVDFLQSEWSNPYEIEGYIMSAQKKAQELYPHLKLLVSQGNIEIPNHVDLLNEMTDLRKTVTPQGNIKIHHPPRGHDDFVDSLALACLAAKQFESIKSAPEVLVFGDDGEIFLKKADGQEVKEWYYDGRDFVTS